MIYYKWSNQTSGFYYHLHRTTPAWFQAFLFQAFSIYTPPPTEATALGFLCFVIFYHGLSIFLMCCQPTELIWAVLLVSNFTLEWWDAVLQERLDWALFVLFLSTLVGQPTELILDFFCLINFTAPLPPRSVTTSQIPQGNCSLPRGQVYSENM